MHNKLHVFEEGSGFVERTVQDSLKSGKKVLDKDRLHGSELGFFEITLNKKVKRSMKQAHNDTKRTGCKHWTYEERIKFDTLCREKK